MTTFKVTHLIIAILSINGRFVGRKQLSLRLGIGEGATRNLIKRLKEAGLLRTVASGCVLTAEGRKTYEEILNVIRPFEPPKIDLWKQPAYGLRLAGMSGAVGSGLELRDEAVRAGALGAVILVHQAGRLMMPGLTDLSAEHPKEAEALKKGVELSEGDALLVTWANERHLAETSALSAAVNLLRAARGRS
jgi:hypothetical protein